MDDLQRWKIITLGWMGFSHRLIASRAFEKPLHRVTDREIWRVANTLRRNGVYVTGYRSGTTKSAIASIGIALKQKSRKVS